MRRVRLILLGLLAGLFGLTGAGPSVSSAATGVQVDLRVSEAPGSPVVGRVDLYGASYALIIGIDNYTAGWPRLSKAVEDARLVAAALRTRGFEVELLTDVAGDELRRALRQFFAIKGADPTARLFLWYAGHGYTEEGEGYLIPADAPPRGHPELLLSALHMRDLGAMVRIAKARHVLAVFDSCFAGTIFTAQRSSPPAAVTHAVVRPVRQFLTSGDADQEVSDDGLFRELFLRALAGEETADANRDGYLTGSELGLYLEDRMVNLTQAAQTPRSGKLRDPRFDQGDFVFVLPAAARATVDSDPGQPDAEPGPADGAAFELAFWNSIQRSDDPAEYRAYLDIFPGGTFVPLAQTRLAALSQSPGADAERVSYGGEWVLELWVEKFIPRATKLRIVISDNGFSVPISVGLTRGTISGEIGPDGILEASGQLRRVTGWPSQNTLSFAARYWDGQFRAQGVTKGRGAGKRYLAVLTRAAAP